MCSIEMPQDDLEDGDIADSKGEEKKIFWAQIFASFSGATALARPATELQG